MRAEVFGRLIRAGSLTREVFLCPGTTMAPPLGDGAIADFGPNCFVVIHCGQQTERCQEVLGVSSISLPGDVR